MQPARVGKYEIRSVLGRGAMAVVYVGYDPLLEREVAVKVIASAMLSEQELKQRFEREAKAVARLQHPNIVTVYDMGYDEAGSPYIAMELLKGLDLEKKIKRATLGLEEKLSVVAQTCHGLGHAHESGIIHRDVKPANLFVTDGGTVKVMDFGVARWAQSSQTQTGQILGTAEYMPPEQIEGEEVDGRADIFSIGVILYQLLTGKRPFGGAEVMSVFFNIVNVEPPEIALPNGERVPELQAIVSRALAKRVEDRYQKAGDVAEDIKNFLKNRGSILAGNTLFRTDNVTATPTSAISGSTPTLRGLPERRTLVAPGSRAAPRTRSAEIPAASPPTERSPGPLRSPEPSVQRVGGGAPTQQGFHPDRRAVSARTRLLAAAALLASLALGTAGFFQFRRAPRAPDPEPRPKAVNDLSARFELAQNLLERGNVVEALETVVRILDVDPRNVRALALKEEILKRSTEVEVLATGEPAPTKVDGEVRGAKATPSAEPDPRADAAHRALEASSALARGDVETARALVDEGARLAPQDPRWKELSREIDRRQHADAELRDREAKVLALLQRAAAALAASDLDQSVNAYEDALKLDPQNVAAASGIAQVNALKAQGSIGAVRFTETDTQFIPGEGVSSGPKGFDLEGVAVKSGTADPRYPAQIVIEHVPEQPRKGQSYKRRVKLQNSGQRPVTVKSLEILTKLGDRQFIGRGIQLPPRVARVEVQSTEVLYEIESTWTEEQTHGSVQTTVVLVGNDKLVKTLKW